MPGLVCPGCGALPLEVSSMELGADESSDERAIQVLDCRSCRYEGIGFYDESRRGASGTIRHRAFESKATPLVRSTLRECRELANGRCRCFAHELMRRCRADWEKSMTGGVELQWRG